MGQEETDKYINATVDLFTRSARTPILRTPDQYGMKYEDVFFPAMDGVTLEGWFIPGYNYFGKNPQLMLEWFETHMK